MFFLILSCCSLTCVFIRTTSASRTSLKECSISASFEALMVIKGIPAESSRDALDDLGDESAIETSSSVLLDGICFMMRFIFS